MSGAMQKHFDVLAAASAGGKKRGNRDSLTW